ncbi:NUDIX hydrolase [Pseudobutyrivibrio xylanivorans]|uniref:NUDIX domain-containing protein n=1 Tax=Pseudobutyrivibrio xylanivorans TaxID=185007 RepID=A0A5P6VSV5_PSEXY|nr:NUDIX domain-containing protein [Pseudobutyrivibrio xylanivorans]QFJ55378.1 NUDIX domain-containing protein [Pseudobutyrivibrio xylanivorans]
MNYLGDLRKTFGHELLMTVGCGLLLENEKGEVLLQKRSDNGLWCIPGGALEPHETYIEAVKREVFEEVGIKITDPELFGLYSGEDRVITYPNDDVVYSLAVIFKGHTYEGEISDEDCEVLEHRFFAKDEIPRDMLFIPDARPILDWADGGNTCLVK